MAMTTVNTIRQCEEPLMKRALRHCRATMDAFVSNRMQNAVSQAGYVDAKGSRGGEHESVGAATPDHHKTPGVELKPLDENVLNPAIPAFFIGRNKAGLWVARESTGQLGGLFLLKKSALAFARAKSGSAQCAFVFPSERFELDLENKGNPFARHLESLLQVATGPGREIGRCALTAVLALFVLAAIVALQAAIHVHVYLWRLVG